jgi:hypothetical protein
MSHQAFVWDILNNIRKDYIFVTRPDTKLRLLTIVYFLSKYAHLLFFFRSSFQTHFLLVTRLSTLGFVLSSAIFESEPKKSLDFFISQTLIGF